MERGDMKLSWLFQFIILIGFLFLGHIIVSLFSIPLPGAIVGMILLFIGLLTRLVNIKWIEKASSFQLKHLTLLFIPLIAGLFLSSSFLDILQWNILIILIVSSICCLLGTAFTVEWYEKLKRRKAK
ncbi:murein hydrolase transporter LrgA [Peribacillus asahii]|uniref:Murein hydrolase transporter LrgA n=2 Tax=Peribacillus asahii TaxID=228899 RepID=A0A3Q9RMW6_9BACI|nr:murein hydrolase transporter LrgA [Peribacillus asahii]